MLRKSLLPIAMTCGLIASCANQPPKEITRSGAPFYGVGSFNVGPVHRYRFVSYWPGEEPSREFRFSPIAEGGTENWKWIMTGESSLVSNSFFDGQVIAKEWNRMWANLQENQWLFGENPPKLALELSWIPDGKRYAFSRTDWMWGRGPINMRMPYRYAVNGHIPRKLLLNRALMLAMHEYAHLADEGASHDELSNEAKAFGIALCADYYADKSLDAHVSEDMETLSYYDYLAKDPDHARILEILRNAPRSMVGANIVQFNVIKVLGSATFDSDAEKARKFEEFCQLLISRDHDFSKSFLLLDESESP